MNHKITNKPIVPRNHLGFFVSIALLLLGVIGCSSLNSPNLEVRLWDHREAIEDFSELRLSFSTIAIHPEQEDRADGWIQLETSVRELDLTRYVNGQEAIIFQTIVEPGRYDGIWFAIDRAAGTLKSGEQVDVAVIMEPVAINFLVKDGRTTRIGLDLVVMDLSDHPEKGYELQMREAVVMKSP